MLHVGAVRIPGRQHGRQRGQGDQHEHDAPGQSGERFLTKRLPERLHDLIGARGRPGCADRPARRRCRPGGWPARVRRRHDDEVAHDDRIVALEHRLHHELAHAGDGEDGLHDHAAADEPGQRQPEDGHQGQDGVAECVLADDHALGEPLGARRLHVVLPHHLQHALAHVAGESGQTPERRHRDGQDQMADEIPRLLPGRQVFPVHRAQAGDGQPAELDPEQDHEEQGQPEVGGGEAEEHEHGRDLVEGGVLARGRGHPEGQAMATMMTSSMRFRSRVMGSRSADLVEHGPSVGREGSAEVQAHDAAQPVPVLHGQRLVETVLLAQELRAPRRYPGRAEVALLQLGGLARGEVNHDEGDERDAEQKGQRQERAPQGVERAWARYSSAGARRCRLSRTCSAAPPWARTSP